MQEHKVEEEGDRTEIWTLSSFFFFMKAFWYCRVGYASTQFHCFTYDTT